MAQAKTLSWRNSGGGEPHTGMRLCSTHRLVSSNLKNWQKHDRILQHSQIRRSKLSREAGLPRLMPHVWSFVFGSTLHRSRKQRPRPRQKPRARPKRRRDDNLHRHVSLTSGRGCFSSRVENLHLPIFLTFLLSWCCMTFLWVKIFTSKFEWQCSLVLTIVVMLHFYFSIVSSGLDLIPSDRFGHFQAKGKAQAAHQDLPMGRDIHIEI